jgi:DNA-binding response OmpR family regulator
MNVNNSLNESNTDLSRDRASTIRILLVDDDMKFCRLICEYLAAHNYEVSFLHRGAEAVEMIASQKWDAVILDVMLPGVNGFSIVRALREQGNDVPVLMLTALGDEPDRIVGLELGADDYLAKTSSPRELLAHLRALLRRSTLQANAPNKTRVQEIVIGPLTIDLGARLVELSDEPIPVTPVEFDLLVVLAQSRGRVRTRSELINEIRDRNYEVFDRSIDVHISSLRKKLNDDPKNPRFIRTVRSAGYLLLNPDKPHQ